MILELAGTGALDREVPGVVDARSNLVREQLPVAVEQLEREHANVVQVAEQLLHVSARLALQLVRHARRRRDGLTEDASLVMVLNERIRGDLSRGATDGDDAQLALKAYEAFQDERRRAEPLEGGAS